MRKKSEQERKREELESRAANREKVAAYKRRYYAAHREKLAAHQRRYYAANREKVAAHKAANGE